MQNFSSFLSRTNQQQNHIQSSIETGSERSKERGKLSIHSTISLDSSIKIHRPIAQKTKQPVFFFLPQRKQQIAISKEKLQSSTKFSEKKQIRFVQIRWSRSGIGKNLLSQWLTYRKEKTIQRKKNQRIQGLRCWSMCEWFTCWFVRLEIFEVLVLKNKIGYRKPYIRCFVHLVHPHTSSIFFLVFRFWLILLFLDKSHNMMMC